MEHSTLDLLADEHVDQREVLAAVVGLDGDLRGLVDDGHAGGAGVGVARDGLVREYNAPCPRRWPTVIISIFDVQHEVL